MTNYTKSFAETYTMRSRFFHDLGESAKKLADTYHWDTDLGNRAAFKDLVWGAVRHSLIEHHGFAPEDLPSSVGPYDLLAFIESGMSMSGDERAARWPEWHKMLRDARARYDRETQGKQGWVRSDPMVDGHRAAEHHWVLLPLIREALAGL